MRGGFVDSTWEKVFFFSFLLGFLLLLCVHVGSEPEVRLSELHSSLLYKEANTRLDAQQTVKHSDRLDSVNTQAQSTTIKETNTRKLIFAHRGR